jgi:hypothetical protein
MKLNDQIPASVLAYIVDPAVQSAVDAILNSKPHHFPSGLSWDELPQLYRANLAAQQVRCEWAIGLYQLWKASWGSCKFTGLTEFSPDNHIKKDAWPISVEGLWNGTYFGRLFKRAGKSTHYFYVNLDTDACVFRLIYTMCEDDIERSVSTLDEQKFEFDDEDFEYRSAAVPVDKLDDLAEIAKLHDFMDAVMNSIPN